MLMARRIISARYYICKCRIAASPRSKSEIDCHAPRHRFKNPFTMSKTATEVAWPAGAGSAFVSSWRPMFPPSQTWLRGLGGASRDRTDDLTLAKLALSHLSYGPERVQARD